jgi:hypothetical protein
MKNIDFCYWLQGYFEICKKTILNQNKLAIVHAMLKKIDEPLGQFTQWLSNLLIYFAEQDYHQPILNFFELEIKNELNKLFHHVVQHD